MPRRPDLPEYAACEHCNEYRRVTLRVARGPVLCRNCADRKHPQRRCAICHQVAPSELHHVASERQHPHLTLRVCLNCHALLSDRQARWPSAWRREPHVVRCIVQGVIDVLQLWMERSPVAEQCRAIIVMLAHAALCLLPHLRPAALVDLHGLTWAAWGGVA